MKVNLAQVVVLLVIKLHILFQATMLPFARYHLMLQTKLHALSHQKTVLMSQRLGFLTLKIEMTKDEMVIALDEAVLQVCRAADTALEAAVARLEKMDEDGCESVNDLLRRIASLFVKVKRAQGVYVSLRGITVSDKGNQTMNCDCPRLRLQISLLSIFLFRFIYFSTIGYENRIGESEVVEGAHP